MHVAASTPVLASQTIDMRARVFPPSGQTSMWSTDRTFRLAGAHEGLDTYASVYDAINAAATLSAGEMPGLAIMRFRGGFRVHDVHTTSRTYFSVSPDGPFPPSTNLTKQSSVPFAAGNVRPYDGPGGVNAPALVRTSDLVALIDGERAFVPSKDATWLGLPRLVEHATNDYAAQA